MISLEWFNLFIYYSLLDHSYGLDGKIQPCVNHIALKVLLLQKFPIYYSFQCLFVVSLTAVKLIQLLLLLRCHRLSNPLWPNPPLPLSICFPFELHLQFIHKTYVLALILFSSFQWLNYLNSLLGLWHVMYMYTYSTVTVWILSLNRHHNIIAGATTAYLIHFNLQNYYYTGKSSSTYAQAKIKLFVLQHGVLCES